MGEGSLRGKRGDTRKKEDEGARTSDPRKVSVYLPTALLQEIQAEAQRLERSLSWILQKAWKTSRDEIRKLAT